MSYNEEYLRNETRAEMVKKTEDKLFELYKDPNLKEKPKLLEKRGGKNYSNAACECVSAIYNDKRHMMVVSTQNDGAISCLANDSIVEVSAYITGQGAQPIAWGEFQSAERGWLQLMKAMEECTIEAAITGLYESIPLFSLKTTELELTISLLFIFLLICIV